MIMKLARIPRRGWRFYRNTLIFVLLWLALLYGFLQVWQARLPIFLYLLAAVPVYAIGSAIFDAFRTTHPARSFQMARVTPDQAGLTGEQVFFPSRDGLTLSGWFIPGQERAIVIVVHGLGGRGMHMIYHATALSAYGYGVLMFDLRAHGSSEGDTCTWGWKETSDVLGAIDYLHSRPDTRTAPLGVLGVSLGGQIALQSAALTEQIQAVVVEGPSPARLADHGSPKTLAEWISYPSHVIFYAAIAMLNGAEPSPAVITQIGKISPRPMLLISTGDFQERARVKRFFEAAGQPKDFWEIAKAGHGGGYFYNKEAYADKVGTFFDLHLGDAGQRLSQAINSPT
jgi:pimeloyl-ACP methyl ester carboxylesterase